MTMIAAVERHPTPPVGDEKTQLLAWLDFYRATLLNKCAGIPSSLLTARPIPSSQLTLLGLLRHMTVVEQSWFQRRMQGLATAFSYDMSDDPDADFNDLTSAEISVVEANFHVAIATSREIALRHSMDDICLLYTSDAADE